MKVFVTGGAGYIGSATVAHLLAAGHEVTVYDNLSRGHRAAVPAGARFIEGDIGDRARLDEALAGGFEAVVHFAALIEAGESMKAPATYFENNTGRSITLIDAAVAHGVRQFVFSSTAAVYAGKESGRLVEEDPIRPANVYGQTKRMVEEALAWYGQLYGLRNCVLRYFNASGASRLDGQIRGEDHRPETHLIPLLLQVALGRREQMAIFGDDYPTPDGTNIRDYIHVDDLAQAHVLALAALQDENMGQRVYNCGNGHGYSNKEVVETARRVTGHPIPAIIAPRRPGDAAVLVASSEKIQRELGWTPRYPELESIIASAWEWHRAHPHGYGG
ncbi:MAG: UDP-glucose 4-epimerase GalE [Chloroflexi bacterium]|nr:UDP-glucose 4-epimerase GalE [Chloroflexota bacterium]MCI0645405.1 UDP-glucose 4-epimerase GalE [Chloroflexota bacterium]MCI0727206.1 UDP-glucose 4-epimerase GalE [Chloroflexota bacterium]